MNLIKEKYKGLLVCLAIAIPSWILGKIFPIIGSAVIAIIAGRLLLYSGNREKLSNRELLLHQKRYFSMQLFYWASVLILT